MVGQAFAGLEYENLTVALDLALGAKMSIVQPYSALSVYLDHTHDEVRGLELGKRVLARLTAEEEGELPARFGLELAGVIDEIAKRQLRLKRYSEAQESYRKALDVLGRTKDVPSELTAPVYHQLGIVAHGQRQWVEAESYYKQALQIYVDFNDRHSQASAYHQLGIVAQEQRQWAEAELYYKQALQIDVDLNDRLSQASTYHQLGIVAQGQHQWAEAESYFKQALQISVDFNDRHSQALTYNHLGIVAAGQQQWTQTREYLLQALTLVSEYQDSHFGGIVLRNLARVWKASGDAELPKAVAGVLGITPHEAEDLLRGEED